MLEGIEGEELVNGQMSVIITINIDIQAKKILGSEGYFARKIFVAGWSRDMVPHESLKFLHLSCYFLCSESCILLQN